MTVPKAQAGAADIANHFNLVKVEAPTKKDFIAIMKAYLPKCVALVKKHANDGAGGDADDVKHFQTQATGLMKEVAAKYAEFTIYRGKSGADEAAVVFRQESAEEDDATFFYFLDTIKSVKI